MKTKTKVILLLLLAVVASIYYYITIPALNIHSSGFWMFLVSLAVVVTLLVSIRKIKEMEIGEILSLKIGGIVILALVFSYALGNILSSPIVNAKKYQQLLTVEQGNFTEDIAEADFSSIPLLDKDSASLLGNRKMGSLIDMVSQFEVSDLYTQINYQGKPVRVTPLTYASPIKWLTNMSKGIPAYIKIDMATQDTECVRLEEGSYIRYSKSEYFNRNIYRHLRFQYPTFIFDKLSFEIDEEGVPYWICPVKKYNIGLFGGQTIGKVVLCNAITGETQCYEIEDCPQWVDSVYSASLLIQLYDYYGVFMNGFFNSVLSQKGCLQTTDGYNYLAMDDDVWVYTGVTSVSGDESNVGFVLMNQRTMKSKYYTCPGAEEYSAMSSAEGQVQNLGYHSTFPLLLNVSGEPTYFMALKDGAGLVKKYAMVNIKKYQNVAIGDTVAECEKSYANLLKNNGITTIDINSVKKQSGYIENISQIVLDGNSHYYLIIDGHDEIFDVAISEFPQIVRWEEGEQITLEYLSGEVLQTVVGIE